MAALSMPPDVVIRPSGVWNTRVPFHYFVNEHRAHNRTYGTLTVCVGRIAYELAQLENQERVPKRFMKVNRLAASAATAWNSFRLSYPPDENGSRHEPTGSDLAEALRASVFTVREATVVSYVSAFETYVQCWALNYLLAKLEGGSPWSIPEREVAKALSPVHRSFKMKPSWPFIVDRLPAIAKDLKALPHVAIDPKGGKALQQPISNELNAYAAMLFWRDFRNLVVHSGGIVSLAFERKHARLFNQLRAPYATHMGPLVVGAGVQLFDNVFPAVATTHYRAAHKLNEVLEHMSGGRRGHPHSPGPKLEQFYDPSSVRVGLLVARGDHQGSFEWISRFENAKEIDSAEVSASDDT